MALITDIKYKEDFSSSVINEKFNKIYAQSGICSGYDVSVGPIVSGKPSIDISLGRIVVNGVDIEETSDINFLIEDTILSGTIYYLCLVYNHEAKTATYVVTRLEDIVDDYWYIFICRFSVDVDLVTISMIHGMDKITGSIRDYEDTLINELAKLETVNKTSFVAAANEVYSNSFIEGNEADLNGDIANLKLYQSVSNRIKGTDISLFGTDFTNNLEMTRNTSSYNLSASASSGQNKISLNALESDIIPLYKKEITIESGATRESAIISSYYGKSPLYESGAKKVAAGTVNYNFSSFDSNMESIAFVADNYFIAVTSSTYAVTVVGGKYDPVTKTCYIGTPVTLYDTVDSTYKAPIKPAIVKTGAYTAMVHAGARRTEGHIYGTVTINTGSLAISGSLSADGGTSSTDYYGQRYIDRNWDGTNWVFLENYRQYNHNSLHLSVNGTRVMLRDDYGYAGALDIDGSVACLSPGVWIACGIRMGNPDNILRLFLVTGTTKNIEITISNVLSDPMIYPINSTTAYVNYYGTDSLWHTDVITKSGSSISRTSTNITSMGNRLYSKPYMGGSYLYYVNDNDGFCTALISGATVSKINNLATITTSGLIGPTGTSDEMIIIGSSIQTAAEGYSKFNLVNNLANSYSSSGLIYRSDDGVIETGKNRDIRVELSTYKDRGIVSIMMTCSKRTNLVYTAYVSIVDSAANESFVQLTQDSAVDFGNNTQELIFSGSVVTPDNKITIKINVANTSGYTATITKILGGLE